MFDMILSIDSDMLVHMQDNIRDPFLSEVMVLITGLGNLGLMWIGISAVLMAHKSTRKIGRICLCALICSVIINNGLLKNLIARERPFDVYSNILPLIPKPTDYSFPSGHTASSFAAACVLCRKLPKKYGVPSLILAAAIGFSRLYTGVHYLSDVLFGVASGFGISYLAEMISDAIDKKTSGRRILF